MGQQHQDKEDYYRHELIHSTLQLMQLAQLKGFKTDKDVHSIILEHWMPISEIFANTVCVAVQWWLRTEHNIAVWVAPVGTNKFVSYYTSNTESWHSGSTQPHPTYENMMIMALEAALNTLPKNENRSNTEQGDK